MATASCNQHPGSETRIGDGFQQSANKPQVKEEDCTSLRGFFSGKP